ncbi:MAG: hypothetical protein WAX80_00230 [Minisyncoccia bacterium]
MKKLILIIIVVLIGWAVWAWEGNKDTQTPVSEELSTYNDPEGVFSFEYPVKFQVTGREGAILARVTVPKAYMPNTNFSDAVLAINWTSGGTDATCSGRVTTAEGAAGNLYETTTIKKIYDGDCYTFEYIIHSTNIGNYDPSQGITEFDKKKIQDNLEEIISSFSFLVNSD